MKKLYHYFQKVNQYLRRGKKNPIASNLKNSMFRPRVEESKKTYDRKKEKKTIVDDLREDGII